ncbi:DJ-1/PfpI family protein [Clostridioides mangenotii]|uniref:DJ-1/PfpI family protein n=1 Tax=Metaclostridioides mangenotii TaxID=1540 RepID=UPI001C1014DF|nr:DJ-1/PfpI family protein [Clostridioides mangenotii]MBU5307935.1 DJ-1/PfpI family protein [Clostridioides mangenotii]
MKKIIYVYILNTLADWELGFIMSAISMKQNTKYTMKTVSHSKETIRTQGGFTITPDCSTEEIDENNIAAILLPGADTWNESIHTSILQVAKSSISKGILVGAICGATLALSNLGILNKYTHTSNSFEFLSLFSNMYTGKGLYQNALSVTDRNLITSSSAGSLLWAKQIVEYLEILPSVMIEPWYNYFSTGNPEY